MVEQFRAEIDINGDPSGAIAAIKAVENAYKNLDKMRATIHVDGAKAQAAIDKINESAGELNSKSKTLRKSLNSASNATAFRQISTAATGARGDIAKLNSAIADALNTKLTPAARQGLLELRDSVDELDRAFGETAKRATREASRMDSSFKDLDATTKRLNKSVAAYDKVLDSTSNKANTVHRNLRKQSSAYAELSDHINELKKQERSLNSKDARKSYDPVNEDNLIRTRRALADAIDQRTELTQELFKHNAALDKNATAQAKSTKAIEQSNAAMGDATPIEKRDRALRTLADAEAKLTKLTKDRANAQAALDADDSIQNRRKLVDADVARTAALKEFEAAQKSANTASRRAAEYDLKQSAAYDEATTSRARAAEQVRRNQELLERYQTMEQYPGSYGERLAAEMGRTSAMNDLRVAQAGVERANAAAAEAVSKFGHNSAQATIAAGTQAAAMSELSRATYRAAEAQQNFNNANMLNGNAARYAMYDAGQYQMMAGLAMMAPAALGGLAFGKYESMFSDVQRTVNIDGMGVLENGKAALSLFDNVTTTSDMAFRSLLNIGRQLPVSYSDVFDMAAKAGSIGATGVRDMRDLVTSVSKFNVVSDTANAADTMEAFGQISNLNVDKKYDNIASAIVAAGVSSAATDDQIIKMTKELSMAAAGANFATEEIIGLGTGFASLAIPPERARSVFQNLVTTMSLGMASTTPEIKNMAAMLGMNVDSVRSLWKSNPTKLFMQMATALGSMEETQMVAALEGIGLKGQRAVPMFQAIAKNVRESGVGMDILSTSLSAAADGYNDINFLNDAVNAKTDDLASKWRFLVSEAMAFGIQLGAAVETVGGFRVLDVITNALKGLNAILNLPGVGWLTGAAATAAAMLGTIRAISGASMFMQAGRMALANMSGTALTGTRAGNLSYLFSGRDPGTPRGANTGVAPAVVPSTSGAVVAADRAKALAAREAAAATSRFSSQLKVPGGSLTVLSNKALESGGSLTKMNSAVNSAYSGVTTFSNIGKSGTGFGGRLMQFLGGGIGVASLGVLGGLALTGLVSEQTTSRATDDTAAWMDHLSNNLISVDDDGVYQGFTQPLSTIVRDFSKSLQGGYTWTDKAVSGIMPWRSTEDVMSVFTKAVSSPNYGRGFAEAIRRESASGIFNNTSDVGSGSFGHWWNRFSDTYAWNGIRGGEIVDVKEGIKEWGQSLVDLPLPAQIDLLTQAGKSLGYTNETMGEFINLMGSDFYNSLSTNMRDEVGDSLGEIPFSFSAENANIVGDMIPGMQYNYTASGGTSMVDPGRNYLTMLSGTTRETVLSTYSAMADETMRIVDAEMAFQSALADSNTWLTENGSVIRDNSGAIDTTTESYGNFMGAQAGLAAATFEQVAAMKEQDASLGEISDKLYAGQQAMIDFGAAAGLSEEEINGILESLGMLPEQILMDIITDYVNTGDMSMEELMDVVTNLPEGETITIQANAITDEAIAMLEAFGFVVERNTEDGTITIYGNTHDANSKLNELLSYNGRAITFDISVAGDEALQGTINQLSEIGGTVHSVVDVGVEGANLLTELGAEVSRVQGMDGTVETRVTIPPGLGADQVTTIIDEINRLTDGNATVTVRVEVAGNGAGILEGIEGSPFLNLRDHLLGQDMNTPYRPSPLKPDSPSAPGGIIPEGTTPGLFTMTPTVNTDPATGEVISWSQGVTDGTLTPLPNPFIYANANPATNAANMWAGTVSRLNPISAIFGDNTPAVGASTGWAGFTMGLNPMASMFANANPAAATSLGWMAMAMGLSPMSIQSANAAPALATSLGWWAMAMGLSPMSIQRANAAPALATAMSWYARVSSMSPVATIRAVALTGGAESALNYAARPRVTTITAYVHTVGSANRLRSQEYWTGGYTGRGGKYEPAGIVHKGEYVIPKKDVDQSTGLPNLNALGRIYEGQAAPLNLSALSGSNRGGQASGVVDLGAGTIHAIARAVQTQLALDGKVVASSASNHFRKGTRRGSN